MNFIKIGAQSFLLICTIAILIGISCKGSKDELLEKNEALILEYGLETQEIPDLPLPGIEPSIVTGQAFSFDSLENISLQEGVNAKMVWATGCLYAQLEAKPSAVIMEEAQLSEKLIIVEKGSLMVTINGTQMSMSAHERQDPDGTHGQTPLMNFILIKKGSLSGIKAGPEGTSFVEIMSPINPNYLRKAGIKNLPSVVQDLTSFATPTVEYNKVYDIFEVQATELVPGLSAKIISTERFTLSLNGIDPNYKSRPYLQAQESLTGMLRGSGILNVAGEKSNVQKGSMMRVGGNTVQAFEAGETGADTWSLLWPSLPFFAERHLASTNNYQDIIPISSNIERIVDGKKTKPELYFTEGPKWMNGKVYFSNMYFDQSFNADPKKSSIVEMDEVGNYKNISQGVMQTNGLYPYKNNHLLVCDMMGHKIVEIDTKGKVMKVMPSEYEGKPIDGPNDIVTDAKGGYYFTDPQFTMEAEKFQPGRNVYYVNAAGAIKRLFEPNEFAMPNGVLLSEDGKTLFVNNCYDDETWFPVSSEKDNFVWAYDVQEDGSVVNGRKFAKLQLPPKVLDRKAHSSSADGMAIDKQGNIYVATYMGVQIINKEGMFVGIINTPTFPVSLCFGGSDMKTLFICSYSNVYKIKTNMVGYINYL